MPQQTGEFGQPVAPEEPEFEGAKVAFCGVGFEKQNVLGWNEDWECDFDGEVEFQRFRGVDVWHCPQCGALHEEEANE